MSHYPNYLGDENVAIARAGDLILHVRYSHFEQGDGFGAGHEYWKIQVFDLNMVKIGQDFICAPRFGTATPLGIMQAAVSFLSACAESRLHGNELGENYNLWPQKVADMAATNSSEIEMLAVELDDMAGLDAGTGN